LDLVALSEVEGTQPCAVLSEGVECHVTQTEQTEQLQRTQAVNQQRQQQQTPAVLDMLLYLAA